MIDFVRTTTLLKYVWTLRLMLEVGALQPFDGTEGVMSEVIQEEIEAEFADSALTDAQKEQSLARKIKSHPDLQRSLNYIEAIHVLDQELHTLDQELRQALLDLMEVYVSLGRPYADSYDPTKQSVDAIYTHSQSTISLPGDVDQYLLKHERMKDALQVLFTRQNSAHRHYGQMFSDVYALTHLKAGVWRLPQEDRAVIPDEIKFYMQSIGYDIVRVWQDNYVHELNKKLSKYIARLAFPSEIVEYGLTNDIRSHHIEPFIRELRRIDPKVITDYNDFLDYNMNMSLTDNYKRWWKTMLQNMPRFRRANDIPPNITLSNYTQLFRDYERIFGKVPYLNLVGREVEFLEKLKDFSLGNQNLQDAHSIIESMQTTSRLDKVPRGKYSVDAVLEGTKERVKEIMDREFQVRMAEMGNLPERDQINLMKQHERNVSRRQSELKTHQHTLSLLAIPPTVRTRYLYNLLDVGSPVLQIVKDHLGSLEQNGIFFPLYPCVGSFRDMYNSISQAAQVLCQRDQQLVELKRQLGQVYRTLDDSHQTLSEEMKKRFVAREQELLTIPDIREYALSMTREEIAKDNQFIYGKTAGLFDLDEDKQKMNIFNELEDDLSPNHPVNRGERGKIQYQIVIPDPPQHISHAIWMLDSYVDVRPGRPDHGEDRRAFAARKFNSIRSFMPIPTRYIPQSAVEILRGAENEQRQLQMKNTDGGKVVETLSQKMARKQKFDQTRDKAMKTLSMEELHHLQENKLERLHAIAGANLVKLEACIIQDLIELNSWGVEVRVPLDGLKPSQFKHYIQPPYSILTKENITQSIDSQLGPVSPSANSMLMPTRASLVISGQYKLLDRYHNDLMKLQEQGFQTTSTLPTVTPTTNPTLPQHIPSATEIAKSGLTPAEYYAQHKEQEDKKKMGDLVVDATQWSQETMKQLQDIDRLKDYSIPLGFPTMPVDQFNSLQAQLQREQNIAEGEGKKQGGGVGAVKLEPTSKNIRQISSTAQDSIAKQHIDTILSQSPLIGQDDVYPSQQQGHGRWTLEDEVTKNLMLPVPLGKIPSQKPTIPTPQWDSSQPLSQQSQSQRRRPVYEDGQLDTTLPTSPVWQGEMPVGKREKQLERYQAAALSEQLGQLPGTTTAGKTTVNIPQPNPYKFKAPVDDEGEGK